MAPVSFARRVLVNRYTSRAPAASLFRSNRSSVTHDSPIKAEGAKRQCQTPSGALTPHPGNLLGPKVGEKRGLFGSLCQKPLARAGRSRAHTSSWPESSRVLVHNGAEQNDESGNSPRHTASLADTPSADLSQGSAEQPEADTTSSGITTRFWWVATKKRNPGHAQVQRKTTHTTRVDGRTNLPSLSPTLSLYRSLA